MKRFLTPALSALALAVVVAGGVDAQLITPNDQPSLLQGATNGAQGIKALILTVIDFFLGFLGLIATLAIIVGGYYYIISGGDDGNAEKGKKIILYAIIGIIIIILSYAIVNTVLLIGTGQAPT